MDALSSLFIPWFFILSLGAAGTATIVVWIKRKRFPLLYGLLIAIVFLCLPFLLLASTHYSAQPASSQQVEETDVADLAIRTSVALPAVKDQSTQVNVSIYSFMFSSPSSGSTMQPTVRLTPIGTPGVPIVKAFGPRYDVFAIVELNASSFDVAPIEQPEQSLDQPSSVTFTWTVTPKYTGKQALMVMATGRWVPKGGGASIERPLANQSISIIVRDMPKVEETPKPFFSFGQLDVTNLLVIFLSSVLNVPWIIELVKGMRKSRQKAPQASRTATPPGGKKKRGRKR